MSQFKKSGLLLAVLAGVMLFSFADRGIGKRTRERINISLPVNSSLRSSLALNLRNGLKYKGSLLTSTQKQSGFIISRSLVTYQKGSNIYILPYKQKILVPEVKQGYTGMRLIIHSK